MPLTFAYIPHLLCELVLLLVLGEVSANGNKKQIAVLSAHLSVTGYNLVGGFVAQWSNFPST